MGISPAKRKSVDAERATRRSAMQLGPHRKPREETLPNKSTPNALPKLPHTRGLFAADAALLEPDSPERGASAVPATSRRLNGPKTDKLGVGRERTPAASARVTRHSAQLALRKTRSVSQAAPTATPKISSVTSSVKPRAPKGTSSTAEPKAALSVKAPKKAEKRRHVRSIEVDEEVLSVGDDVYIVLDAKAIADLDEEDIEPCLACHSVERANSPMIECDSCLRGFHLCCLDPPLSSIPEGDWECGSCDQGLPPRPPAQLTARSRVLMRKGLGLARIEALWTTQARSKSAVDPETCSVRLRWYCLPEETAHGRRPHHRAREVLLSTARDDNEVGAVLRRAWVADSVGLAEVPAEAGDDVFLCEYVYDERWGRYCRLGEEEEGSGNEAQEEGDWEAEGEEDDRDEESGVEEEQSPKKRSKPRKGSRSEPDFSSTGKGALEIKLPPPSRQGGDLQQSLQLYPAARQRSPSSAPETRLSRALHQLSPAHAPSALPCREAERGVVQAFVEEAVRGAAAGGRCLYVSGIPGTGKTATVRDVLRGCRKAACAGELPPFRCVELNGLRLPSPQHVYSALYEALAGDRLGPASAAQALDAFFGGEGGGERVGKSALQSGSRGGKGTGSRARSRSALAENFAELPIVLLMDELDLLINRSQAVLYNLFDWPARRGSRLSLIGIANTMDLPERLHPRIGSRLAGRRLAFQPYSRDALVAILAQRLQGTDAFEPNALMLAARKVANCSGDLRLALQLCRRAAEMAQADASRDQDKGQDVADRRVTIRLVDRSIREAFTATSVASIRSAPLLHRLLLAALVLEMRYSGLSESTLGAAAARLELLSAQNLGAGEELDAGEEQPDCEGESASTSQNLGPSPGSSSSSFSTDQLVAAAVHLGAQRLVLCQGGHLRLRARIALGVPLQDALLALSECRDLAWLGHQLEGAAGGQASGYGLAQVRPRE